MKKALLILYLIIFANAFLCGQNLQVAGDTAIVLVEGNKQHQLDSLQIEASIERIKEEIKQADNRLLQIEALKAKELEKKSGRQSTLTYFLEMRNKFFALKQQLKNRK